MAVCPHPGCTLVGGWSPRLQPTPPLPVRCIQVRIIVERLAKKCGFAEVDKHIPEAHKKLLTHIRKQTNRKERRKSEAGSQVCSGADWEQVYQLFWFRWLPCLHTLRLPNFWACRWTGRRRRAPGPSSRLPRVGAGVTCSQVIYSRPCLPASPKTHHEHSHPRSAPTGVIVSALLAPQQLLM